MTTQELKDKIGKVLGNSIRCLLPSYWWKTLFNDVADTIEDVKKEAEDMVVKSLKKFNDEHPAIADNTFYMTLDKASEEAQHNVLVMTRLMYNALIKLEVGREIPETGPLYIAVAAYDNESTEEKVYVIHSAQYVWAIGQIVFFNVPIFENSVLVDGAYTVTVRSDGTTTYVRTGNIGVSGGSSITVDSSMSSTSKNPVQNKVVKAYVDNAVANAGGGSTGASSIIEVPATSFAESLVAKVIYVCTQPLTLLNINGFVDSSSLYDNYTIVFKPYIGSNGVQMELLYPSYMLWSNGVSPTLEDAIYELSIAKTTIGENTYYKAILTPFK
jgi:hypothetical protein